MYPSASTGAVWCCAGCGQALYAAEMKFDCGCGWPGFWTALPQAVHERLDAKDMLRR
eukprot:COSAG02_NODE_40748_length_402_cov_0.435644_1_plen_56_part_10